LRGPSMTHSTDTRGGARERRKKTPPPDTGRERHTQIQMTGQGTNEHRKL
jgi:hypothetical protein